MWDNAILLRKIANALIVFSVLAALYGAVYNVAHLPGLFPVRSVRLSVPPQNISAAELLQVMRSEVRGNLVTVDIKRLRQSLEKLPWARSVSIRREFPQSLAVQMEEHQVFARWNNGLRLDGLRTGLVNQYGEIFFAESEQALPIFIGQSGTSAEIAQHYAQFNQQIAALGLSVEQIALSPRHSWQLRLSNGTVLELGREDMQQRLARFVAVQMTEDGRQRTENRNTVKYVDLRYRNGFAVRRSASEKG
jgi:cell division protein FtsQ